MDKRSPASRERRITDGERAPRPAAPNERILAPVAVSLGRISRGPHLPTLVASSISREIAHGRLGPGDQLPTEQALAATFGVSRNVVREAIARLRLEGLVRSRQGSGVFVSEQPAHPVLMLDGTPTPAREAYRGLFELRHLLEVKGAALAAERRGVRDVQALRRALAAMSGAPYGSRAWLQGDLDFHGAIAEATRNAYLAQVVALVSERVRESILAAGGRRGSDDMARATIGEHEQILMAIEAADADAAAQAMRLHLAGAAERIGLRSSATAPGSGRHQGSGRANVS